MRHTITPEKIVESYAEIDFLPIFGEWMSEPEDGCCGLTAYCLAHNIAVPGNFRTGNISQLVAEALGWTAEEVDSFVLGFDGEGAGALTNLEFYNLGEACADKITGWKDF